MINENGSVKFVNAFITISLAVIGMVICVYSWATATFASKAEISMVCSQLSDIRADQREIKLDIKEISKVINSK